MNSTTTYPDGLDRMTLTAIELQVSEEIASAAAPTSGLLDGSARARRNRRMLDRALKGITTKYGVTLAQAAAQERQSVRPAPAATVDDWPAPQDVTEVEPVAAVPAPRFCKHKKTDQPHSAGDRVFGVYDVVTDRNAYSSGIPGVGIRLEWLTEETADHFVRELNAVDVAANGEAA